MNEKVVHVTKAHALTYSSPSSHHASPLHLPPGHTPSSHNIYILSTILLYSSEISTRASTSPLPQSSQRPRPRPNWRLHQRNHACVWRIWAACAWGGDEVNCKAAAGCRGCDQAEAEGDQDESGMDACISRLASVRKGMSTKIMNAHPRILFRHILCH